MIKESHNTATELMIRIRTMEFSEYLLHTFIYSIYGISLQNEQIFKKNRIFYKIYGYGFKRVQKIHVQSEEKKQYYLTLYFYLFHKIILSYSIYPCIKHTKLYPHTGQHIQTIFIEKHVQSLLNFYEFSRQKVQLQMF